MPRLQLEDLSAFAVVSVSRDHKRHTRLQLLTLKSRIRRRLADVDIVGHKCSESGGSVDCVRQSDQRMPRRNRVVDTWR